MCLDVEKKGRKAYIDVIKGIAMFLMLVGHSGMKNPLIQFIYSFHMPLFFFAAGMTSRTDVSYLQYAEKRVKSLLVPYLLAACVYSDGSYKSFLYVIYASRASIEKAGSSTPLWFLPCLFAMDLAFNSILRIYKGGV